MKAALTLTFLCLFAPAVIADWRYTDWKDEFTDKPIKLAAIESKPFALTGFASQANATLRVRVAADGKLGVWVVLSTGQFAGPSSSNVSVRFDDGPAMRFWTAGSADGSTNVMFVSATQPEERRAGLGRDYFDSKAENFVRQAKKAKRIRFDALLFRHGREVLDFTSELPLVIDLPLEKR